MSRHSFGASIRRIAREVARAERVKQQEHARQAAARIRELRNAERQAKADAKEAARLHVAAQIEEADDSTHAVEDREKAIHNLLAHALANNPAVDLASLLKSFTPNTFDESPWRFPAPNRNEFTPETPGFFARMLPGATRRYERRAFEANRRFDAAEASYRERLQARATAVATLEADESTRKSEVNRLNASVRELQRGLEAKEHSAVVGYFKLIIERSLNGEPNAVSAEVGYAPDSRHLVVDLELPELSVVPEEMGFRYVKSADRIDPIICGGSGFLDSGIS